MFEDDIITAAGWMAKVRQSLDLIKKERRSHQPLPPRLAVPATLLHGNRLKLGNQG